MFKVFSDVIVSNMTGVPLDSHEGEAGEFHLCCLCAITTRYNTFCASAILIIVCVHSSNN